MICLLLLVTLVSDASSFGFYTYKVPITAEEFLNTTNGETLSFDLNWWLEIISENSASGPPPSLNINTTGCTKHPMTLFLSEYLFYVKFQDFLRQKGHSNFLRKIDLVGGFAGPMSFRAGKGQAKRMMSNLFKIDDFQMDRFLYEEMKLFDNGATWRFFTLLCFDMHRCHKNGVYAGKIELILQYNPDKNIINIHSEAALTDKKYWSTWQTYKLRVFCKEYFKALEEVMIEYCKRNSTLEVEEVKMFSIVLALFALVIAVTRYMYSSCKQLFLKPMGILYTIAARRMCRKLNLDVLNLIRFLICKTGRSDKGSILKTDYLTVIEDSTSIDVAICSLNQLNVLLAEHPYDLKFRYFLDDTADEGFLKMIEPFVTRPAFPNPPKVEYAYENVTVLDDGMIFLSFLPLCFNEYICRRNNKYPGYIEFTHVYRKVNQSITSSYKIERNITNNREGRYTVSDWKPLAEQFIASVEDREPGFSYTIVIDKTTALISILALIATCLAAIMLCCCRSRMQCRKKQWIQLESEPNI